MARTLRLIVRSTNTVQFVLAFIANTFLFSHGIEVLAIQMVAGRVTQFSNLEAKFQLLKYLEASIHSIRQHGICLLTRLFTSLFVFYFITLEARFKVLQSSEPRGKTGKSMFFFTPGNEKLPVNG